MKNKALLWVVGIVLVCALAVLGIHLYLLESNRGIQIHIGSFNIMRLGSPTVFFPAQFEQSFVPFDPTISNNVRKPKYERNVIFESESQGDITAKDITTGQEDTFSWNDNTHYMCVLPVNAQVSGLVTPVDPAKTLKNYVFLNSGNAIAGTSEPEVGYFMFKRDIEAGDPLKLILINETRNVDGGLDILSAIAFTKHTKCATPTDTVPDFSNLLLTPIPTP